MRKVVVGLLLLSFLVSSTGCSAKTNKVGKVLIIGDSRTYGISKWCNKRNKFYFVCEGSVGVNFIDSNLNVSLGKVMPNAITNSFGGRKVYLKDAIKRYRIKKVVYALGVNGCGKDGSNYKYAIKTCKKLRKLGVKVYISKLLPVDGRCRVSSKAIKGYNTGVSKNWKYTISYTKIKGWSKHSSDGLHYDKYIYDKVLNKIYKEVK